MNIHKLYILIDKSVKAINGSNDIDIYKTILAEQKATYDTIVYIWISITAILVTGTLFWNFFLANRKIESEVEAKSKNLTASIEKSLTEISEKLETRINEIKEEFSSIINNLTEKSSKELKDELINGLNKNEREFDIIWGDIHRSFKAVGGTNKNFDAVVERAFMAIMHYQKAGDHESTIGELIDEIESVLKNNVTIEQLKKNKSDMIDAYIRFAEKFIPATRGSSKKFILSKLNECKQ